MKRKELGESLVSIIEDTKSVESFNELQFSNSNTKRKTNQSVHNFDHDAINNTILDFLTTANGELEIQKENIISRCYDYPGTVIQFINDIIMENPWAMKFTFPNLGVFGMVTLTSDETRDLLINCFAVIGLEL